MKVNLLCFAYVREILGKQETQLEIPENMTASTFLDFLCKEYPSLSAYRDVLKVSMNEVFLFSDDPIIDGATLAVFPPVSGG